MAGGLDLRRVVINENNQKKTRKTLRVKKVSIEQQKITITEKKFQIKKY